MKPPRAPWSSSRRACRTATGTVAPSRRSTWRSTCPCPTRRCRSRSPSQPEAPRPRGATASPRPARRTARGATASPRPARRTASRSCRRAGQGCTRPGYAGPMPRQMAMVGFLQAQNCTNLPASWRHPESRTDFSSADFYREIARVLEAGKFHLAFFDDRLAMPDRFGNDHRHTVERGIRCVKLDPLVVLMTMGMATKDLGLGATCSTTYCEPFHVARLFATIDLMTDGRAAWNVVTSLNDGEAQNMGCEQVIEHDLRYDRADEFMEVVLGHWDSWADDALIVDKVSGRFADAAKVRRLDHVGPYFSSRG